MPPGVVRLPPTTTVSWTLLPIGAVRSAFPSPSRIVVTTVGVSFVVSSGSHSAVTAV